MSYRCPHPDHQDDLDSIEALLFHVLVHQIELGADMTSNQDHLNADIAAIGQALSDIVSELKAQAANGQTLDFTAADALVASAQGEAAADAPPAPAAPADGSAAPADGTSPAA